jgi:hypothetical protein
VSFPREGSAAADGPRRRQARHLHAFLDAILPGLGHLVAGRRARAALFGIPVIVLILLAGAIIVFTPTIRLVAMAWTRRSSRRSSRSRP